ncbi:MAG: YCF48-related protein [Bacteroidota bacterium]
MRSFIWTIGVLFCTSCVMEVSPAPQVIELGLSEGEELHDIVFHSSGWNLIGGGIRFDKDVLLELNGQSWTQTSLAASYDKMIFDVEVVTDSSAYFVGMDGKIWRTTNRGEEWTISGQTDWLPVRAIASQNEMKAVAVGGDGYNNGLIWRTLDGGENWIRVDTPNIELRDICFVNETTGFAAGYGSILKTTNGGQSWEFTRAEGEFFSALFFLDQRRGFAVGRTGSIVKTEDQGETWNRLRNGNLTFFRRQFYNDILFLDKEEGFIIGDDGLLLHSTDGGENWDRMEAPTDEHLWGMDRHPNGDIYVCGDKGTLFSFTP